MLRQSQRRKLSRFKAFSASSRELTTKWPEERLDLTARDGRGFFPASVGQTLQSHNAHYSIVRKLGFGSHSNVWLAHNPNSLTNKYTSVKILSAYATQIQGDVAFELEVMRRISSNALASPHIVRLVDNFHVSSHHGKHLCIATELLGSSMRDYLAKSQFRLSESVTKHFTKQLLHAVSHLHALGVIHTDIKFDNVLALIPNVEDLLRNELRNSKQTEFTSTYPPRSQPLLTAKDLNSSKPFPTFQLTDFGTSTLDGIRHAAVVQPEALRAPEVIIGRAWDHKVDIWNIGCLVFEALTGTWLFTPQRGENYSAALYHLGCMAALQDHPFDPEWAKQGLHYSEFFHSDGVLRLRLPNAQRMRELLGSYDIHNERLASFLSSTLRLDPADRPEASELLQHAWLQDTD